MYIYPKNLKAKPTMWLWALGDISIITVLALIGIFSLFKLGSLLPLLLTSTYGFITIRFGDFTVLDFLRYGVIFCVFGQQKYIWRCEHESV